MGAMPHKLIAQRLMDETEAAEYISMSTSYLQQSRSSGAKLESKRKAANTIPGPKFKKIGTLVRYDINDLDEWIDSFKSVGTLAELNAENIVAKPDGLSMDSEKN